MTEHPIKSGYGYECQQQIEENGYAVVRGLLNPATDLEPLKTTYPVLIDELAEIYTERSGARMPEKYKQMTFMDRLCYLVGISHGKAFHDLDPAFGVMDRSYSWDGDLPPTLLPEMFNLINNPAIISIIREVIGPEIFSAPLFHHHIKCTHEQMDYMKEISIRFHGSTPADLSIYDLFIGTTVWHKDAEGSMANARQNKIINAWIPLTESTLDNGCLLIVPGSHRMKLPEPPFPKNITNMGVPVEAEPGDIVFTHHNTLHCSLENKSDNQYRWAFSTRYCAVGEPSARPYLPGFIAHSLEDPSRVLEDVVVWQDMWKSALENIASIQPVPLPRETSLEEAIEITRYWEEKTPNPKAWLNLNK